MYIPQHKRFIKNEEEEELYMLIKTYIHVLNLKKEDFVDAEGSKRESFKVNYSQSDGEVVGSLTVRKEIFDKLSKGGDFEIGGEYRQTRNGNYISWQTCSPKLPLPSVKTAL